MPCRLLVAEPDDCCQQRLGAVFLAALVTPALEATTSAAAPALVIVCIPARWLVVVPPAPVLVPHCKYQ